MRIAQLRYGGQGGWALYFGDRYGGWTLCYDLEASQSIETILNGFSVDLTRPASSGADRRRHVDHLPSAQPKVTAPPLGGTSSAHLTGQREKMTLQAYS
jgi:hypothetical protein